MIIEKKRKEYYKEGDIRKRTHFCLLPLTFNNTVYWLEKVFIKEKYIFHPNYHIEYPPWYDWEILSVKVIKKGLQKGELCLSEEND